MLDFETPTYITAKESQQMQSGKEYRKDYEESIKGRNLTGLEVTPALLHVKYATKIASEVVPTWSFLSLLTQIIALMMLINVFLPFSPPPNSPGSKFGFPCVSY